MKIAKFALHGISALALGAAALGVYGFNGTVAAAADNAGPAVLAGQIPVAEFVKKPNMQSPRISPDGTKLAYLAANNGKQILVVKDLRDSAKPAKQVLAADEARESGDRSLGGFRWVGSDDLVMTVISREDLGGGLGDFRRLVSYNVPSGKLIQQAWRGAGGDAASILHIDHDKGSYLLQRDAVGDNTERWGFPEVVRVDVKTGDFTMVQRTNPIVRSWVADSDGVVRMGFNRNRDDGKFRMLYRSNGKEAFRTVFLEADKTFTAGPPLPEMFIPGTDTAYAVSRHEGFSKVYKLDMSTMKLSAPVFETPGFDVQGVISDQTGKRLLGYETFDGEMRNQFVDPHLKEVQVMLDEIYGKNEASIVSADRDYSKIVIYAGGKSTGGGFYLYDTKAASLQLLNWQRTNIKNAQLNPVKAEWLTASDGTKIQAIVTYPRHRKGKNLPVVIIPHGGPFGVISATNSLEPWNQPLAEAGYVVIQPNYRGSGGYGRAFEQLGREPGGYGKRMQDDLTDVLNHYAKLGIVDAKRASIMGWSYGGYAAARGAQRDGNLWKCAVAGAGVYDMAMMNRWDANNLGKFSSGFQATSDDPDGISSARNTGGKWAPILIVTAKRDARIPMEQAEALVGNLKKSGKVEGTDFRYIVQPQGTHNLPYDDVHIQWIEEALAWLTRFNPAYVASDTDKAPAPLTFK
ncbi:MAG: S9 family peptidase [Sphingomonadales bacterium]|nr:S9 family peptidase [Sphingomonadales bacterium]